MKKKFLSTIVACVFALITVFSMASISFGVETGNVVKYTDAAGAVVYDTSLASAIEKAPEGATITLLKSVTLSEKSTVNSSYSLWINKSLTIDGQGQFSIDCSNTQKGIAVQGSNAKDKPNVVTFKNVSINNNSNYGRCVDTRGGYLDLNITGSTITAKGEGNTQPLTVGGPNSEINKVNITNSYIIASNAGYGIITFNPVDMTIDHSEISGYAALYMREPLSSAGSGGSKVLVTNNSVLTSDNPHGPGQNDFGTIVLQDSNIAVTVNNSTVTTTATSVSSQALVLFNSNGTPANNDVSFTGNSKLAKYGDKAAFVNESKEANNVTIKSGEMNFKSEPKYIAPDKVAIEFKKGDDGRYYVGSEKEINAVLADAPKGSVVTVLQGNVKLDIPTDGVEIFNKGEGNVTVNGTKVEPNNEKPVITEPAKPADPQTPDKDKVDTPKTGDEMGNLMPIIAVILVLAALGMVFTLKRRHN